MTSCLKTYVLFPQWEVRNGPHIFNLGHGITPDADPENVQLMIDTVRNG